jgi:hypothetical protein
LLLLLPPPLPPEPLLDVVVRVVPLVEVFALEEMMPVVLVRDSTVALALAVDVGDSAEVKLALDTLGVVLVFAFDSAEVE